MAYSIQELAKLAGVSTRTLRYYDQIGLLPAQRQAENGYRTYSPAAVDQLQFIRYFQEFGFSLTQIQDLLSQPQAEQLEALTEQRRQLQAQRDHLTDLLNTLDRTLAAHHGGPSMSDTEKFAAFKQQQLTANEQQFGAEVRQRYGQEAFETSQQKFANLSLADYQAMQATEQQLFARLKAVADSGDIDQPLAQEVYELHRRWLCFTWNNYSAEAHRGLAQLYLADKRFANYYNEHVGRTNAATTLVAIIQRYAH